MDANTRIIDLSVGQLTAIITGEVRRILEEQKPTENVEKKTGEILTGIAGLAKALHCSKSTAQRLKTSHKLDGGFIQVGSKIIIKDEQALLEIAGQSKAKRNKKRIV